jgi:acetyl/propionyl-CoA carboxylase alpha subunit
MGKAAIRAAEAAEYENAGTIEFLVDAKGNFYFIEMNTRIQVEHPVTEEVTGIDLIKQQIHIANGEKLEFDQKDIKFEKHAIECRSTPRTRPATSRRPRDDRPLLRPGRPRRAVDSHAYSGYVIPPYYDSMIGKLICFGSTRKVALERAYRALSEYLIRGIKTTIPLHKAIMADPLFIEGKATTATWRSSSPDDSGPVLLSLQDGLRRQTSHHSPRILESQGQPCAGRERGRTEAASAERIPLMASMPPGATAPARAATWRTRMSDWILASTSASPA